MFSRRRIKVIVLLSFALAAVSVGTLGYTDAGYFDAGIAEASPDGWSPSPSPRHRGAGCRSSTPNPSFDHSAPTLPPTTAPAILYCDDDGNCYSPHRSDN